MRDAGSYIREECLVQSERNIFWPGFHFDYKKKSIQIIFPKTQIYRITLQLGFIILFYNYLRHTWSAYNSLKSHRILSILPTWQKDQNMSGFILPLMEKSLVVDVYLYPDQLNDSYQTATNQKKENRRLYRLR